jgi:hypothetical protein
MNCKTVGNESKHRRAYGPAQRLLGLLVGALCGTLLSAAGCAVVPDATNAPPAAQPAPAPDVADVHHSPDHAMLWPADVERALPSTWPRAVATTALS